MTNDECRITNECPNPNDESASSLSWIKSPYIALAVCAFLLLAVFFIFGQTLRHDFVNFDDDEYVCENYQITHGLTVQAIAWAFTTKHASNWHPLTWLSHMLDYQLYALTPWGHHLTNVLIHSATAIILFLVLRRMTGDLWTSAFVAAVFAVHPLRAESVAWVAERKDVLSGLFFMLTLAAYVGYARHPFSLARYLAVIVLFALGLMAKSMLVTLPFVLLFLDYWPLGRMATIVTEDRKKYWGGSCITTQEATVQLPSQQMPPHRMLAQLISSIPLRLVIEKIPLFMLSAASCAATIWAQSKVIEANVRVPLLLRIGNAAIAYVAYLGKFFYPVDLAVLYPYPISGLSMWKLAGALLVLLAICWGVVAWRSRYPYLIVGWLWYMVMLIPVIGLVQVGVQSMADRYTYLPQIGLCIALAWGVEQASRSLPYRRWACGIASALVLMVLIVCAWRQTSYWCDSKTIWTHTLECTSQNFVAHNNVGYSLTDAGRFQEAIEQCQKSLLLKPDYAEAHNNLAVALADSGRLPEAMEHYERALRLKPDNVVAHFNLGNALDQAGRPQEAIEQYQLALRLKPDFVDAHYNLGITLGKIGRLPEAIEHYKQALQFKPDHPGAHNNLGNALLKTGHVREAIEHCEQALRLKPKYSEAHNNLGNALVNAGRLPEAINHYEEALRLNPNSASAHFNLGLALVNAGRLPEAIEHYRQVLRLKPDSAEAYFTMGMVLTDAGRTLEAIKNYEQALSLKPDYVEAHYNLALSQSKIGRLQEAIIHFKQAIQLDPDYLEAYSHLALTYAQTNQPTDAIATAQKAVNVARSIGQAAQAKEIENWLNSYRAEIVK